MKKSNRKYLFPIIWTVLAAASLISNTVRLEFPHVRALLVILYFLPAALFAVFYSTEKLKKTKARTALKTVLILMLIPSVIASIFMFIPGYPQLSKTLDPTNYMITDDAEMYEQSVYAGYFPEEIPENAEDIKYEYTRQSGELWCIGAQWTLPDAEYEAEKARITELCRNYDGMVEVANPEKIINLCAETDTRFFKVILMEEEKSVTYILSHDIDPQGFYS